MEKLSAQKKTGQDSTPEPVFVFHTHSNKKSAQGLCPGTSQANSVILWFGWLAGLHSRDLKMGAVKS